MSTTTFIDRQLYPVEKFPMLTLSRYGISQMEEVEDPRKQSWLSGTGCKTADIMVVGSHPGAMDMGARQAFSSTDVGALEGWLAMAGLDASKLYFTNAVKFPMEGKKKVGKKDISLCKQELLREIEMVQPTVIVCLGAVALDAVASSGRNSYKFMAYQGSVVRVEQFPHTAIVPTWPPYHLVRNPDQLPGYIATWSMIGQLAAGEDVGSAEVDPFQVVSTAEELTTFLESLLVGATPEAPSFVAIDAETKGHWKSKTGYMRTLQLTCDDRTAVVRCYPTAPAPGEYPDPQYAYPECVHPSQVVDLLRWALETNRLRLVGHNLRYDAEWLLRSGLDVSPWVGHDTMLMGHLIRNLGSNTLTVATQEHTNMGRYDAALNDWKRANPTMITSDSGYACIPEAVLFPYAAGDTQATWKIMMAQWAILYQDPDLMARITGPRGVDDEVMSLWTEVLEADKVLMAMEDGGLTVDMPLLAELVKLYNDRCASLRAELVAMAHETLGRTNAEICGELLGIAEALDRAVGLAAAPAVKRINKVVEMLERGSKVRSQAAADLDKLTQKHPELLTMVRQLIPELQSGPAKEFNPASSDQVAAFLFGAPDTPNFPGLGLIPLESTDGTPWDRVINQGKQHTSRPATGGDTLSLLQDQHPFVGLMAQYRSLEMICKNFLRNDDSGGIPGNLWGNLLHASFSMMSDTGRLKSSNPNVQNFPKASEAVLPAIFGFTPPGVRCVFIPPAGWELIEADYAQAELFTLANLSGDQTMITTLNTPGQDLHDKTAIDAFFLTVFEPDGVTPVNMAAHYAQALEDLEAFEAAKATWLYVDPAGTARTYKELKSSIRISAKAINFGICYGRGALAIANQVNAETGLSVTSEEIQVGIDGWKATYPSAWAFLANAGEQAVNQGYVDNVWGRRRYFERTNKEHELASMRREAANFPIQSTVADTVLMGMTHTWRLRKSHGLQFRIVNQIHDALIVASPPAEKAQTIEILQQGLGAIRIPTTDNLSSFSLTVDIDELGNRWKQLPNGYSHLPG